MIFSKSPGMFLGIVSFAAVLCFGQGPGRNGRGGPPGIGGSAGIGGGDWWENPVISNLNLSETQRKQIQTTTRDFRNRLVDARGALQKSEGELQDAFNDGSSDDRRVNDMIDRVVKSRGDLMKLVTQMSWKLRGVLTAEQWQELQRRRRPFGPRMDGDGRGKRGPGGPAPNGNPPPAQPPKPGGQQ